MPTLFASELEDCGAWCMLRAKPAEGGLVRTGLIRQGRRLTLGTGVLDRLGNSSLGLVRDKVCVVPGVLDGQSLFSCHKHRLGHLFRLRVTRRLGSFEHPFPHRTTPHCRDCRARSSGVCVRRWGLAKPRGSGRSAVFGAGSHSVFCLENFSSLSATRATRIFISSYINGRLPAS